MKKLFYLLFALPLLLISCDDDNKLPDIQMNVEILGATKSDGVLYIVQGETLTIDKITVSSTSATKGIALGGATYYWDYYPVATTNTVPYTMSIETGNAPVGNHLLQIECPVFAVDYSAAVAVLTYKVKIVESADEIPSPDAPAPETPEVKAQ